MATIGVIELPDGRLLAWEEWGPPDGRPVIFFHGTPSYRRSIRADPAVLARHHVRLIAVDRPGYGLSSFHVGRRLVDWPVDVAALLDHLDLPTVAVMGHSGGGPHALAVARALPDRIAAVATIGGFCPLDRSGPVPPSQRLGQAALRAPFVVRAIFAGVFEATARWPRLTAGLIARALPAADRESLAAPEAEAGYMTRTSPTAARAAAQDMALMTADWGFRLEDIRVPLVAWHGTDDFNVPFHHSVYATEHVPTATLHRLDGEGHLVLTRHLDEIIESVFAAGGMDDVPVSRTPTADM